MWWQMTQERISLTDVLLLTCNCSSKVMYSGRCYAAERGHGKGEDET